MNKSTAFCSLPIPYCKASVVKLLQSIAFNFFDGSTFVLAAFPKFEAVSTVYLFQIINRFWIALWSASQFLGFPLE